nr:immunoglobulin heavy chain junction region [Macaca mulatta]MOV53477.1 immunoglobulin heavy chain junction region [Macaca mulatta]MOV54902.1 immunoglobulin heavy chain junction region [Macaca mulatta]MOV54982.1 immunoglobulin heavy chain junction region [Macaca mulatta]MOV55779.1 immunoglobulin heavy chain junction region [Macaca mulatta]
CARYHLEEREYFEFW